MKPKAVAMLDTENRDEGRCSGNVAGQVNSLPALLSRSIIVNRTVFRTNRIHLVLASCRTTLLRTNLVQCMRGGGGGGGAGA